MGDLDWGVQNRYSRNDVDGLRGHEKDSTSAIMNDARRATSGAAPVAIRGDDKSAKEIREDDREEQLEEFRHPLERITEFRRETRIAIAADFLNEGAGEAVELGKAGYETLTKNLHAAHMGDILHGAVQRDQMQRALLSQLNIPQGAKEEALERFTEPETEGEASDASRLADKLHNDPAWHAKMAILQLHCDQGMNAAREMIDSGPHTGVDRMKFSMAHADVAKRCAEDPAFKAGFDAVVWAKKQGDATYKTVCTELASRDARYDAHHVAWRG